MAKRKRPLPAQVVLPPEAIKGEQDFLKELAQRHRERDYIHYKGHKTEYTPELHASIIRAYYRSKGNMAQTSRITQVPYGRIMKWRAQYPDFDRELREVWEILVEEVHGLYMERVMNPETHMPAWQIYFLKTHDPRYQEKPKQKQVQITITDDTLRSPKAIGAGRVLQEETLDNG